MREPDQPRDRAVEHAEIELHGDKDEIVRVQGGVELVLDGGEIGGIVLRAGMVAEDGESRAGEEQQGQVGFGFTCGAGAGRIHTRGGSS